MNRRSVMQESIKSSFTRISVSFFIAINLLGFVIPIVPNNSVIFINQIGRISSPKCMSSQSQQFALQNRPKRYRVGKLMNGWLFITHNILIFVVVVTPFVRTRSHICSRYYSSQEITGCWRSASSHKEARDKPKRVSIRNSIM